MAFVAALLSAWRQRRSSQQFDKAIADSVSLTITLAVVGYECLIVGNVSAEFFDRSEQFARDRVFVLLSSKVKKDQ